DPDLVAVTGDIVDSDWHHCWIVPTLGRLKWRMAAFAVLGNHDYWHGTDPVRRRLRRINIRVLSNTWEQIEVRGQPLLLIGKEGPWTQPTLALKACPPAVFRLCLSHTAEQIYGARDKNIDLVLAGHVHGGQFRLPLIGAVHTPSRYSRRFDCGTFALGPTVMH